MIQISRNSLPKRPIPAILSRMRTISTALAGYDGKNIAYLGQITAEFGHDPQYLDALIACCTSQDAKTTDGATWLLKDRLNEGASLTQAQSDALLASVSAFRDWPAKLHVSQMFRHLSPSMGAVRLCAPDLAEWTKSDKAMLRAWALDAFAHLAGQFEGFNAQATKLLQEAQNDESPAVQARLRNLK